MSGNKESATNDQGESLCNGDFFLPHRDEPCVVLGMGLLGPLLATPLGATSPGGSRTPVLRGTQAGLSSVFGMGTGGTPPLWSP